MSDNSICPKTEEKQHLMVWDYKDYKITDNYTTIIFNGKCFNCGTKFQKIYSNPKFTIIMKGENEPKNFDYPMVNVN